MDFFERQDQARRNTKLLVVYFVAGVALLVAAVYLATLLVFAGVASRRHHFYSDDRPQLALWQPQLFLGAAAGTLAVITLGSIFKTSELAHGGGAVAPMLRGRLLNSNTADPDEGTLLDVGEEMAIASGVPVTQGPTRGEEPGLS